MCPRWVPGLAAAVTLLCPIPADRRCPRDEVQGRTGATVDQLPGVVACEYVTIWGAGPAGGHSNLLSPSEALQLINTPPFVQFCNPTSLELCRFLAI